MMEYFCLNDEREGSCYQEYQQGRFEGNHWLTGSLFMHDDIACEIGIYDIFFDVIETYDPYSACPYTITKSVWDMIVGKAVAKGGKVRMAISELTPWAEENFKIHEEFTVIAI